MKEQARNFVRQLARGALGTDDVGNTVRLGRLALERKIYRVPFTLPDLREALASIGFARGRVIWVQSSWNEFYNLKAKPSEVIALMRDMLGPDGTLLMPAFPIDNDPSKVLEIDLAPSASGLLTELFRRTRDTRRSIHLTSSVCAVGPAAEQLLAGHERTVFPWGADTPFSRLMDADALLVGLGIGRTVTKFTPLHAVECLLYDEVPFFRSTFDGTIAYDWRRKSGESGHHEFMRRVGRISPRHFARYYPSGSFTNRRLSNLNLVSATAKSVIDRGLDLGRRGITIYEKSSVAG